MRFTHSTLLALVSLGITSARAFVIYDTIPPVTTLNSPSASDAPLQGVEIFIPVVTPAEGRPILSVDAILDGNAPALAGELRVTCYENSASNEPGAVLGTTANTETVTAPVSGGGLVSFVFANPVQVAAGQRVWIGILAYKPGPTSGAWTQWSWRIGSGAGPYPACVFRNHTNGVYSAANYLPAPVGGTTAFPMRVATADEPPPRVGGDFTPISGAKYARLFAPATNDAGVLAFRGTLAGDSLSAANRNVIATFNGVTRLVAQTGAEAPGAPLTDFSKFGDPVINGGGNVAFTASLKKGEGATAATDTGVWTNVGGTLSVALRESQEAPGVASGKFTKFNWIHLSTGSLLVGAQGTKGAGRFSGVWEWNGTTLTKVVATGDTLPLTDSDGVVKTISRPASTGTGNAQSRLASPAGKVALLITTTDGRSELVQF